MKKARHFSSDFPIAGSLATSTGVSLLGLLWVIYLCATLTLMAGATIKPWIFPASIAFVTVAQCAFIPRRCLAVTGAMAAVIIIAIGLNMIAEDISYDGNDYHQEAVVHMAMGWNPFYTPAGEAGFSTIWVFHYCIGFEIIESAIFSSTGLLQGSKCINLILIAATFFIVYGALSRYNLKRGTLLLISLTIILNPICITQMFTFYIDFAKYCYMVLTIVAALGIAEVGDAPKQRRLWAGVMSVVAILAIATKFNIAFDQALFMISIAVYFLFKHRAVAGKTVIAAGLIAMVAGIALSLHPYISNWIGHGHPLYPLMGNNAVDIMGYNLPAGIEDADRFSSFFISLLSLKPPVYDTRLGGFGPLMPLLLAVATVILVRQRKVLPRPLILLALYSVAACFIFDQSWWMRYQCQLWLVIAAASLYPLYSPGGSGKRMLILMFSLTILNGMTALARTAIYTLDNYRWHAAIKDTATSDTIKYFPDKPQVAIQLREAGLDKIISLHHIPHSNSVNWYEGHDMVIIELSPTHLDSLKAEAARRGINFNTFDHDNQ